MQNKEQKIKPARWYHGLITLLILVGVMFYVIVACGGTPQIPLIIGCIAAAIMSAMLGYRWEDIFRFVTEGIMPALEALLILMCIGILVGVWIASGTVPSLIYYGLKILSANYFLPASALICGIVSFAIGSWGAVGTVGIALMGIGTALEIPLPMVAGSIISGAYFGDAASPLSDAANLSAAVVGTDVFRIVKSRILPAFSAFGLTLLCYYFLGRCVSGSDAGVTDTVTPLMSSLTAHYNISPLCLLPLPVVIICVLLKLPAIPSMLAGILAGILTAVFFQGVPAEAIVMICTDGCVSDTGDVLIDTLFTAGGILSMMNTISIAMIAMAFGGIMQKSGQIRALVMPLLQKLRGFGAMNCVTTLSCLLMNLLLPDQSLSIAIPGQMMKESYEEKNYGSSALGMALIAASATSPMVPWNTCGIYCTAILGVRTENYLPFAFYNLLSLAVVIALGFLRSRKMTGRETHTEQ